MKLYLVLLLFSALVLCGSLALATTDPELKQCKHQCEVQRQFGQEEKERCLRQCDEYHREKKERERRGGERADPEKRLRECQKQCERQAEQSSECRRECKERYERERERGQGEEEEEEERRRHKDTEWEVTVTDDPAKRLKQCQKQCERQGGQERSLCRLRCQQRYERERERRRGGGGGEEEEVEEGRHYKREEKEEEGDENPYVFEDEHFVSRVRTEHGRIDVLQRFTEKSKLLRGIENYRVALLEANPQTFIAPSHWDADGVLFVAKGRGTITMVREERRVSFNIECGDVIRVRAGTPVYLINTDENERLLIAQILRPVNLPDKFEAFHPEFFYREFSWELLESALKTNRSRLEQIFRQRQGVMVKASKEQIRGMSHREEGAGIWPFGGEASSPFNLLKRAVHSNDYGQLFEAKPEEHKQQLQDLGLAITMANITRGSMIGPYYNSKSTKISIVLDGEGYFEMICPHVGGGRRTERGQKFKKIRSDLRQGKVFVVPAGHPVASVASRNNNLILLCFEVNAEGNTRYPLAGGNNVVKKMEREAKELSFGVRGREVDEVFGNQKEELFLPGPKWEQMEGRDFV